MNCSDVKKILPQYLADQCSIKQKQEISEHISGCPHCMEALDQLEEPILNKAHNPNPLDTTKILNKARRDLIIKTTITAILSIIIFLSTFWVIIPGILTIVRYPKTPDITRSLIDITQFTSPSLVGGFGNSMAAFGNYSFNVSAYTYQMTGTKQKGSGTVQSKFNMITGTYNSPVQPFSNFIHPKIKVSDNFLERFNPDIAKNILIKSGENTVAVVDISLKSILDLEEVADTLKDIDVQVLWMAVECGSEDFQPKNMTRPSNQYVQWGIPGNLFNPFSKELADFNHSKISEYKDAVINELKWLDENKHYIAADKNLLNSQGFDNTVSDRAKYIIENGFKVYGLRITGPSTELIKLEQKFDIRTKEVIDIDFYYWK